MFRKKYFTPRCIGVSVAINIDFLNYVFKKVVSTYYGNCMS